MDKLPFEKALNDRRENNNFRSLNIVHTRKTTDINIGGRDYVDFASNDYLSLSNNPKITEAAKKAIDSFGASASSSRLMSGSNILHEELEGKIAAYKGYKAAITFGSGYQANVGILPAIVTRHDAIIADELIHASLIDGAILSRAKLIRYKHNDTQHLEDILLKNRTKYPDVLIVTESLFSMDGDIAPLREIVELKNRYSASLFVDEAHATGVFGSGIVSMLALQSNVEYLLGTFSKALGSYGGFLTCDNLTKDYLVNFCRSFIYSTALPPSVVASSIAAITYCRENPDLGAGLLNKAEYFRNNIKGLGLQVLGTSQIVPVVVNESSVALKIQDKLREHGYNVLAVRPPTVKEGSARIRFSICLNHTTADLDNITEILKGVCV